jgi:hypothetical protein
MQTDYCKITLRTAVLGITIFLLAAGLSFGQQQINLAAGPTTATLPDGSAVPMWGYTCGAAVTGSTATCAPLNPAAATTPTVWSPVVITVPTGQDLIINLSNNLPVPPGATTGIPTSLVIVGQLGGGLGTPGGFTTSPDHTNAQQVTWPIASPGPANSPPPQGPRVQSFSTQVATGLTTALTWTAPRPGTYLIESGTHPSIQGPMGLYGILVVTTAPAAATGTTAAAAGIAYPGVTYDADVSLLFSEIDPVQNSAVNTAVNTAGFSETRVWSGQPGQCGNPNSPVGVVNTCYPPAVNYTPLYYLINGVAFNKTNAPASLFPASAAIASPPVTGTASGSVLVRLVNAGLRMHVPSIVGSQTGTAVAPALPPSGFSLIAEDGNPLPGVPRVQSEVFMAAGKTYDVMISGPVPVAGATSVPALPVFDRQLSLSGNAIDRDAGMLGYIGIDAVSGINSTTNTPIIAAGTLPAAAAITAAVARPDTYNSVIQGHTLTVSDPAKGVIANDTNVNGVQVLAPPTGGTLTLNANGTFTYVANAGTSSDSFTYCANGSVTGGACSSSVTATVTLGACGAGCLQSSSGITVNPDAFTSNVATSLSIKSPGVLRNDLDSMGYPLTVSGTTSTAPLTVSMTGPGTGTATLDSDGGFNASVSAAGTYTFTYQARNSQGVTSANSAKVTLTFPTASGLKVTVVDGRDKKTAITDYRWIIEEDRTYYVDPKCQVNPPPAGCPTATIQGPNVTGVVPNLGTNFHTSYMPVIATGCTGTLSCESGQTLLGQPAVCDVGNGVCRTSASQQMAVDPSQVALDPTKRYYVSVLPGDAANPFINTNLSADCVNGVANATNPGACGHGMGGAPIAAGQAAVTVLTQPAPFQPAKLTVFVFEDDFPLNGEQDAGGGIDVLSPNEPGLGGFNITLFDDAGGTGDATGQPTYDMFNQPLVNSLAGTIDPSTGQDACPVSKNSRNAADPTSTGITGTIVTCPKYEADGKTLSPLAGQAVVANLYPGRYGVVATPGADRIGRGEEWLQTNTLDGQKAHDSFLRVGEPGYFQEYGPAGYHVSIGFANPAIINARKASVCNGSNPNITGNNCANTLTGVVTDERMSRTPDERLYSSGDNSSFGFTQCYVSFGDPDGIDFAFTKCNADGSFSISGLPDGNWRVTVFDQWNDMLVDGLSTPVRLDHTNTSSGNLGQVAINQWQSNIYTTTFFDQNGNGVRDSGEQGLTLVATNNRFRDGSFSNFNNTDLAGNAGFNEIFPLFSWYVLETDSTRYKSTGTHVVYDAGGPSDGSAGCGTSGNAPCGDSAIAHFMANTAEVVPLPTNLRVPGAFYCANADCTDAPAPLARGGSGGSTGRVDPAWVVSEGWQGFSGQNNFIEFGKKPYAPGENGGIRGHVVYASTRPFDDPQLLLQLSWEPLVPGVTINLYKEGTAPDGSQSLTLVDTTKTTSWDDWAQGFRSDRVPNMNCPGQMSSPTSSTAGDLFFFTLYDQPQWLDFYNSQHGGSAFTPLPNNAQFKCYDGMHNWNQVQPAPYDGMYQFPSVTGLDPATGKPTGTNCTACVPNPDSTDPYRFNTPMLSPGKYVVEIVVPPGYELVKEEDKNILIGDNYIAPVTVEFPGLGGAIYILPDQAAVGSTAPWGAPSPSAYNANNAQNSTSDLGVVPRHEGDTGSVEEFWPCVGQARVVPDYISLFPGSQEVAPFAGATRNLCDRKEVTLQDQASALAKFYVFTSTHAAAHFTGIITDDFTSEFDPFSPTFGEKFSPANLPVSIKDWSGTEISRVYSDQWGAYDGLTYSTWEVNPPNPTGYAPTMMVTCMNDEGPIPDPAHPGQMIPDPLYQEGYSQFCYEIPFMPGQTQYMDTPVTPTEAFAGAGYDNVDCAYPGEAGTTPGIPAIKEVDGDGIGPWVSAPGKTLTITALGDQNVNNYGYVGPSGNALPWNQKTVTRHYGFGTARGTVTIGGVPATINTWNDSQIVVIVPGGNGNVANVPPCNIQQQQQYGGPTGNGSNVALCGELAITTANGQKSIDTVTVTIGGKAPTHVPASGSIQSAIDAASPGDLIIIDPTCTSTTGPVACTTGGATGVTYTAAAHNEILLMWKPVRLQGVGAASSIIDGNTHPAGKLDFWRRQVNCLMGLAIDGSPISSSNPFDPTGSFTCGSTNGTAWKYFQAFNGINPQVDRLPLEATVGWDANLNGNLAELLQEPSLMGALEGAGITVLSKGVRFPSNPFDPALFAGFPVGTTLLTNSSQDCGSGSGTGNPNPFPSNFQCNPSSIDGLTITNSSQGGGGIFVHGWGHNIEIANNRVQNNSGTLSGGINIGQGEYPPGYLQGSATNAPPGSCMASTNGPGISYVNNSLVTNQQLPYCHNLNVNVHNNAVMLNSSTGDELFSATPAGAGGISFTTGSDNYRLQNNWICGNLSVGDGGGVAQLGFVWNGDIEHNSILFNQSTNPTIPTNGGGVLIYGAPDVDPPCGATTDADCLAPAGTISPSDGTGPGLVINANLIMGNAAESGSGGGLRLHNINGNEVINFPMTPGQWYAPLITNNIITDNVAGWDGAGISLQDALAADIINNTIVSNDTTASAGVLFNTLGAPLASSQGPCPVTRNPDGTCPVPYTTSTAQPAGLVSIQNSAVLMANIGPLTVTCPPGHYAGASATNGTCKSYSYPLLYNNIFWQNRAFYIGVGSLGTGTLNQQHLVSLFNGFTQSAAGTQATTGACPAGSSYWDIGVRGDTAPNTTGTAGGVGGVTGNPRLAPSYSVLTDVTDYPGANNLGSNPAVLNQYCNGSRVPPEATCQSSTGLTVPCGWQVPPGIADATVPNPVFSLTPAATVDEGNNWINIAWGPLSLSNPNTGATLGNYAITSSSPAATTGTASAQAGVSPPLTDFFGNVRTGRYSIGAVQPGAAATASAASVSPATLAFGNQATGTTTTLTATVTNTGNTALAGGAFTVSGSRFSRPGGAAGGTCAAALAAGASCTINVAFAPNSTTAFTGSLAVSYTGATVTGSPVALSGTGVSMAVTPASLAFGNVATGATSSPLVLTVQNATGGARSLTIAVTAPFSRPTGSAGGTCGATINNNGNCTINIVYAAPATATSSTGTVTIATSGGFAVANSPVQLTGTSVSPVVVANLAPTSWDPQQTRNCPGTGAAGRAACAADPIQGFTLTNGGNVNLTGVTAGALSGANAADYAIVAASSTCGTTGYTTLAPGATCAVTVQFKPLTSEPVGIKNATLSVTDSAGTQSATLAGVAQ